MEMEKVKPTKEHKWLRRIVGEWTYESEAMMGPDAPAWKSSGTQSVRMLGDLWSVGEIQGEMPDGTSSVSIISLGYDPAKEKFVGTFIASMMTHLWPYEGTLNGNVLTLDSEGPSFKGDGSMSKYQDLVEIMSDDEYTLSSQAPGEDGKWHPFMKMVFKRKK